jgi:hypothetical protein
MPGDHADPARGDEPLHGGSTETDDFSVASLPSSRAHTRRPTHAPRRRSQFDAGPHERVGRRRRLRRGAVAVGVVLLALVVLLGPALSLALSGALAAARDRIQAAFAPRPLVVSTFTVSAQPITIPAGSAGVGVISISPAQNAPETAYACWPRRDGARSAESTLELAHTANGGQTWQPLALPQAFTGASGCTVQADALTASGILLAVDPGIADAGTTDPGTPSAGCVLPDVYVLHLGETWQRIPLPAELTPECSVHLALAMSAVYLWADAPLVSRGSPSDGLFAWSPDLGASWHTAPTGLGAYNTFTLLGVRAGGRLLAQATRAAPASGAVLLESLDGGDTWAERGPLPGNQPIVVPPGPSAAPLDDASTVEGGWGPLYATSADLAARPGGTAQYQLWTALTPQGPWQRLPAIPVTQPGSDGDGQDAAMLTLGTGPRGGLLVALAAPGDTGDMGNAPARQLWLWDPTRRAWLLGSQGLPPDAFFDGVAYQQDSPTLWLTVIHLGVPPKVDLYTMVVD